MTSEFDDNGLDHDLPAIGRVVALGSAVLDAVGRPTGPLVAGSSTPGRVRVSPGGVARNVAENLARLGVPVSLITAVGDDPAGRQLLDHTARAGVDVRRARTIPGASSGQYLALLDSHGSLHVALDQTGVIEHLTPQALAEEADLLREAQAIFVDANLPPDSLEVVIRTARDAGVPIAADPTSIGLADRLRPYLSQLWLVTPNEAEAGVLCPHPVPHADRSRAIEAARHLVGQGVKIALVTMAEFGVGYASAQTVGHIPAVATEIVDPTGAGDAQTAAVLFALLSGIPLDESVRLGAAAASITLRTSGSVFPELSLEALYDELR